MPLTDNPLMTFLNVQDKARAGNLAQQHADLQTAGVLSSLQDKQRARESEQTLKAALATGDIDAVAKINPQAAGVLANLQETRRQSNFYSPQNMAQFQTPGAPGSPSPPDAMGGGPAMPATTPTTNLSAMALAGAAQGIKGTEPLLNHLAQRDQARATMAQAAALARERTQKDYDLAAQRSEDRQRSDEQRRQDRIDMIRLSASLRPERPEQPLEAVMGDDGKPTLVPRSEAIGRTPATRSNSPERAIPASVSKAYVENATALRKIDRAMAEIDKTPDAFGLTNYLGDTIKQRTDPEGVTARAIVADIGSLKIHDRSGAAVTAAEFPRLKPFVPTATDNPETIKKKLAQFRIEYEQIQNDIGSIYSPDQGYKALPQSGGTPARRATDKAASNTPPPPPGFVVQ